MLPLKGYQQRTLDEFSDFLKNAATLVGERGIRLAFLDQVGDEERHYKPIPGAEQAPYICIKIPTGGGKTLVASHTIWSILENYLQDKGGKGLVLWFVPSDAIRTQTLNNLRNRNHPYREVLDAKTGGSIKVLTLEEALSIQKQDLQNNLCILVAGLQAFRRTDKAWLKVFQNNGALLSHFENLIEDTNFLDKDTEGEIIYSLGNVIKINNPIVILDEGHNVQTKLSYDLLTALNPAFVLEFTATPRSESNVLIKVLASELKAEQMVKIPIYLSNFSYWQEAIRDGVTNRKTLEELAEAEKKQTREYIRPIALLQAEQEKEDPEKIYVEKIHDFLLRELGIPSEQIAVKTATRDEISGIDLLSPECAIRYIITVNALKEGWDCPFAYVLISVANIGSKIAVEQTMGRILRLPQARDKKHPELNYSYVYTSSENFSKASEAIIDGLEANGFSSADLRENKGKIIPEKTEHARAVTDANIRIPYISLRKTHEPLAFNRDLLGRDFRILDLYTPFTVNFHDDQNQKIKIDIDKKDNVYRITYGQLVITLFPEDFSLLELSTWLRGYIRHIAISAEEMGAFIERALKDLSKTHSIEELSLNRFRLGERMQEEVQLAINRFAKERFDSLLTSGGIDTAGHALSPSETVSLARVSPMHFRKHLFEAAYFMNGEETALAERIDLLENISW